jgi:glycosyltransferase involved in cell wall biosynthesis
MNVLVVTGIFPPDHGGPASYVPRIAAALARRGHRVEVVCLSDRVDHHDSDYPFRLHRIQRRLFWPWRIVLTTFTIWRTIWHHDLIYVNGLGAESALAALLAGRPAVHKVVGDYAWERATSRGWFRGTLDEYQTSAKPGRLRLLDWVRTFPLQLANQVIVPSEYLRKIVSGWGISKNKIRVIYNAVECAAASPVISPMPRPWHRKTLVTVCRLVPWKGVDGLIRLLSDLPDTRLIVVGDGAMRALLESEAQSYGVAERIQFLGRLPQDAVRRCLEHADAFVLNSTYEGLPHVVLEAMAAGVPVIARNAGGTSEVVEDNVTGLLVPVGDTSALKAAIERLWREPALGRQLTAEAARRLLERFDFNAMINATEATLLATLELSGATRQPVTVRGSR